MSAIELIGLGKRFGRVRAVSDFSLEIARGEMIALVGPSGCGKTTLLRMIAGFERPDRGDIRLDGKSVIGLEPERRRVGIVFQDYALFPHMSVARNIGYGLKFDHRLGKLDRERRIDELLDLVGLQGYRDRAPHELSAGQQQRIAIARAVAPRPDILLLDEPMSALDAMLREELRMEMRRLQRQLGITTLHVTHDQEEAIAVADRVAVMRNGALEQVGPPREVYLRPTTEFVAKFVGRGNLLGGTVVEVASSRVKVMIDESTVVSILDGTDEASIGERVGVLVRPSRIEIGPSDENRIQGRVDGIEFLGENTRLRIRACGTVLHVLLDSRNASRWENRSGETIDLSFRPDDAWLVKRRP